MLPVGPSSVRFNRVLFLQRDCDELVLGAYILCFQHFDYPLLLFEASGAEFLSWRAGRTVRRLVRKIDEYTAHRAAYLLFNVCMVVEEMTKVLLADRSRPIGRSKLSRRSWGMATAPS